MDDLLKTAKQMEYLIDALPADKELDKRSQSEDAESNGVPGQVHLDVDTDPELLALEAEMQKVNEEYLIVLKEAGEYSGRASSGAAGALTRNLLAYQRRLRIISNPPFAQC